MTDNPPPSGPSAPELRYQPERGGPSRGTVIVVSLAVVAGIAGIAIWAAIQSSSKGTTTTYNAASSSGNKASSGGSSSYTTTTSASSSSSSRSTSTTAAKTTTTTTSPWLSDALSPTHDAELTQIDAVYKAIEARDWSYARSHFTNGYGNGPSQPDSWWAEQYGSLREHRLAPARSSGGSLYVGLVTHESDSAGGPYSFVFCIPFSVSGSSVKQTGPATRAERINGVWVDWKSWSGSSGPCG